MKYARYKKAFIRDTALLGNEMCHEPYLSAKISSSPSDQKYEMLMSQISLLCLRDM